MKRLGDGLRARKGVAVGIGRMERDAPARELWAAVYPALSEGQPGLTGAILARAEAHVLRFSMIYALLDGSPLIRVPHLNAVLALWRYAEESARIIFGDATGDAVADRILSAIKDGPMMEVEINDLFKRNVKADRLKRSLKYLAELGRIKSVKVDTGGRPATQWSTN